YDGLNPSPEHSRAQGTASHHPASAAGFPYPVQHPVLQPYRRGDGPYPAGGQPADAPAGRAGGPAVVRICRPQAVPDRGGESAAGGQHGYVQPAGYPRYAARRPAGHLAWGAAPGGSQQHPVSDPAPARGLSPAPSPGELPAGGQYPRRGDTPAARQPGRPGADGDGAGGPGPGLLSLPQQSGDCRGGPGSPAGRTSATET